MAKLNRCWIAVWSIVVSRIALADPVVISFEEVSSGTAVIQQYAWQGVTFNQPTCVNESSQTGIADFARSGVKALEQCYAAEFCSVPLGMDFTTPERQVKVWAGYSFPIPEPLTVVLTAFDSQGGQVARTSVDFPPQGTPRSVRTPLEVVAPTQSIVRAEVSVLISGQTASTTALAIDDLEFDTQGPPPVCAATAAALPTIRRPDATTITEIDSFILEGVVATETPLVEATLTVIRPDGTSTTSDLLGPGIVKLASGPFGPTRVSPILPGVNLVRVSATNCRGTRSDEAQVTYLPPAAGTRFYLKDLEITQTIQDLNNTVPLIAGKPTVARAYLQTLSPPGGAIHEVSGTMSAVLPDGGLPGGPVTIYSLNAITVQPSTEPQVLNNLAKTLNFELPPEWTRGSVHLMITSLSIDGILTFLPCLGCSDPLIFRTPRADFVDAPPVRLVAFTVPYTQNTPLGNMTFTPAQTHFDHLFSWLRRAYPTDDVQTSQSQIAAFTGVPDEDFDRFDVNDRLSQLLTLCRSANAPANCGGATTPQTHFFGMVDDGGGFLRGQARNIPGRIACGPAGVQGRWLWDTDGSYADWYGGHEIAHTYGRRHPGFCEDQPNDDDDFPYSDGRIGGNFIGFDFGDASLGIPRALFSPLQFTDLMTYCDFQWMSDYTYRGILQRLLAIENPNGGGEGGELDDALLVQGQINLTRKLTRLRPFLRLSGLSETPRPAGSPFTLELRNTGEAVLAAYPLAMAEDSEALPGEDRVVSFDAVVPWITGTRRIVLVQEGSELASRAVSRGAPQVQLIAPEGPIIRPPRGGVFRVEWEGSDPDGEPLTYTLFYSNDNGASWEPIDTGLTGQGVEVPLARLRGGDQALFRILATDGVNTSQDDQDFPMTVRGKAPNPRIFAPADGDKIAGGQALVLRGEGSDLEDGALRGKALEWTSDRQGVLGHGGALSAGGLDRGVHRISLTARDLSGATGTVSVAVEVLAAPLVARAEVDPVVPVGTVFKLDGRGSTGEGPLEFTWEILAKPAGSSASVSDPHAAVASFTADRLGLYSIQLLVQDAAGQAAVAQPAVKAVAGILFVRGEVNGDGSLDISDAVRVLGWLFTGDAEPRCEKAADANDDGTVDLSDAVHTLGYLFTGGRAPAPPYPQCGLDPTGDTLSCLRPDCR